MGKFPQKEQDMAVFNMENIFGLWAAVIIKMQNVMMICTLWT